MTTEQQSAIATYRKSVLDCKACFEVCGELPSSAVTFIEERIKPIWRHLNHYQKVTILFMLDNKRFN